MWLSNLIVKRKERERRFLTEKEKYIMAALWESSEDLSVYEIMGILHKDYQKDLVSTKVERLFFRLSQKEIICIYTQDHILFARYLITRESYSELMRQEILRLQKKYRWIYKWEESNGGSLTKEETEKLRELLNSLDDNEK